MKKAFKAKQAFNGKIAAKIHDAIREMEAHQKLLAHQSFSASDLLQLFVDPQHHNVLMQAYELCEPSGQTQELYVRCEVPLEWGGGVAHVRFRWHAINVPHAFYVPHKGGMSTNYPARMQDGAPQELRDRFEQVSMDLMQVARNFALVQNTLTKLNKVGVCETPAQMRYHWPCIVTLLRRASGSYASLADNIENASMRAGDQANIPVAMRGPVKETNEIIARHMLLLDIPTPEKTGIEYELLEHFKRW